MFKGARGTIVKLHDGNQMPLVGLGTYALYNTEQCETAVNGALANGYRLFDTAKFYGNEKELGNAFQKYLPEHNLKREDIFIETKANIRGNDVIKSTADMVEHSLCALQSDYIDLLLIHYPKSWGVDDKHETNRKDRSEAFGVLEKYQDEGKLRSIGVSNFEQRHIEQLIEDGHRMPAVNQCEFHPHLARPELLAYCRQKNILFQAHTSLAKHAKTLYTTETLIDIAKKRGLSIEQTLLGYAYWQNVAVIPKSGNAEHIESNLKFLDEKLTDDELKSLDALDKFKHYSDCDGWNVQ